MISLLCDASTLGAGDIIDFTLLDLDFTALALAVAFAVLPFTALLAIALGFVLCWAAPLAAVGLGRSTDGLLLMLLLPLLLLVVVVLLLLLSLLLLFLPMLSLLLLQSPLLLFDR